ncbi:hypothetical protein N9O61_04415 [Octadecabacter sp.]|nr:hypothetical protein [Octadecabacter sp.]
MARQPVAVPQYHYGLPPAFWLDAFVIAFFGISASILNKYLGGDRLSPTDKAAVVQDVFTGILNMNGKSLFERYISSPEAEPHGTDFNLGLDPCAIVTFTGLGKVTPDGDIYSKIRDKFAARSLIALKLPSS